MAKTIKKWFITEINDDNPSQDKQLAFDGLISFEITADAEAPSQPIEEGSFATYNKVKTPREITTQIARMGTETEMEEMITQLERWRTGATRVNFLTPEIEYPDFTLTSYNYTRTVQQGEGVIIFDLTLQEINSVQTNVTTTVITKPRNPTSASNKDMGLGKTRPPTDQERSAIKAFTDRFTGTR